MKYYNLRKVLKKWVEDLDELEGRLTKHRMTSGEIERREMAKKLYTVMDMSDEDWEEALNYKNVEEGCYEHHYRKPEDESSATDRGEFGDTA